MSDEECMNSVSIEAPDGHSLREFVETVRSNDAAFDFDRILPMPPDLAKYGDGEGSETYRAAEFMEKYRVPDASTWGYVNWGTKSKPCEVNRELSDSQASYTFYTNDEPPVGIYAAVVQRFPNLTVRWLYADGDGTANVCLGAADIEKWRKSVRDLVIVQFR